MAGHENDGGLVAQRLAVELVAGLGIARLEQHLDHRGVAARQALLALPDQVVEHPRRSACAAR